MDSKAAASTIYDQVEPALCAQLNPGQKQTVQAAVMKWLVAWIDSYQGKSAEDQHYLVNEHIPEQIQEQIKGMNKKERLAFAETAYDRWRVDRLNQQTLERAEAFRDSAGDPQQLKAGAEDDFRELKAIEDRFLKDFPKIHKQYQRKLSESKLDCLYVIRDGAIASRRLAL